MDIIYNLLSLFMYVTVLLFLILVCKRKLKFSSGILFSSLSILLANLTKIYIYNKTHSTDLIGDFIENAIAVFQTVLQTAYTEADVNLPAIDITVIKNMYTVYFPSLMIIYSVVISFGIFMLTKGLLRLIKKDTSYIPCLSDYKFPKSAFWVLALTYIFADFISNSTVSGALQNINILLMFFASFCGFSYIEFKMKKKIKNTFFRFFLYIAAFSVINMLSSFVMILLVAVALADSLFNLRSKNNEVKNG